ncbi:hypothetical protein G7Y89_g14992 [Cudoniella acicularis]|uniref:DUF1996 domain-containing protein n=1 Tax=Cudoniella acicularis TaxID=354080 RepID=A0A8H4VPD5_9HELO|nr:hypothetical protein G7Y89_g14992 [Cudoniella acicularis]
MRFSNSMALRALPVISFGVSVNAFWRMPCRARSGLARMDPLVSVGTTSGHVHAIHGSSGFSETADTSALLAGECTSCQVSQDKSAYWTPALYFQNTDTNTFTLVDQVGGMLAYYLLYPNAGQTNITAFPSGFEMISGDTNQRNFTYPVPDIPKSNWNVAPYNTQSFLRQAALGFNCLNYQAAAEGSLYRHFMPDKTYLDAHCTDGVRFELMFPSCWNGKDLTSADKKSHVAFPSEVMTGDCPSGFETRLPSLFYEIIWNTYAFKGQNGQFVIANGDPTGYGFHGDFMMGWDETFLQNAVDTCTNLSGQIQDCPLFTIQDESTYSNCNFTVPEALVSENVVSGMTALPGNVPIMSGPAYAKGPAAGSTNTVSNIPLPPASSTAIPTSSAVPTLSYSAGTTASSSGQYAPGGVFAAISSKTSLSSGASAATTTAAPSLGDAADASQSFFSTQYETQGQKVMEVFWVEEVVTVTESETTTVFAAPTPTAQGAYKKRHMHAHLHQHRRLR